MPGPGERARHAPATGVCRREAGSIPSPTATGVRSSSGAHDVSLRWARLATTSTVRTSASWSENPSRAGRRLDSDPLRTDRQWRERNLHGEKRGACRHGDGRHGQRVRADGERDRVARVEVGPERTDPDHRAIGDDHRRRDRRLREERQGHREQQLADACLQPSVDALRGDVPRRQVVGQRDVDGRCAVGTGAYEPADEPVAERVSVATPAAAGRVAAFLAVAEVVGRGLVRPRGGEEAIVQLRVQRIDRVVRAGVAGGVQLLVDRLDEDAGPGRVPLCRSGCGP